MKRDRQREIDRERQREREREIRCRRLWINDENKNYIHVTVLQKQQHVTSTELYSSFSRDVLTTVPLAGYRSGFRTLHPKYSWVDV